MTVIWNNFTVLLVSEFEILIWICFVVTDLKFQLLSRVHAHGVVWCTYFVAIFMKRQDVINYIDNVFWLRLEILYIFNIKANKVSIFNFSNSCKNEKFQRLKLFPKFCLRKSNALENLFRKLTLYCFIYHFSIFTYVVATLKKIFLVEMV